MMVMKVKKGKKAGSKVAVKAEKSKSTKKSSKFPFIGRYVILRCYYAGVHAGFLVDYDVTNDVAILKDTRRFWGWKSSFTLSEAAMTGLTAGKIGTTVSDHMIRQVYEMLPCTKEAENTIRNIPDFIGSQ